MRLLFIGLFWVLPTLAWGTEYCLDKVIDCKALTRAACSDQVLTVFGHNGTSVKLKAATPTDTVHGSVTIAWRNPPAASTVCVTWYDADQAANAQHKTIFKKPALVPSRAAMQVALEAMHLP